MKKISYLLSVLLCVAFSTQVAAQKKVKVPEITFEKLQHDYGTLIEGEDGTCSFAFKNTGKEPLVLSNVFSSCGCTVPTWPREPVMPGKTATIDVKYNTSRIGGINKIVTVISNDEANPRVELRIVGKVIAKTQTTLPEKTQSPMQANP